MLERSSNSTENRGKMSQKGTDEIYCRSCGEIIKEAAEICPECGVRNEAGSGRGSGSKSTGRAHDPSQYETNVSDSWYLGVAAGLVLWIALFAMGSLEPSGGLEMVVGLLALIGWALMPIAVYYDSKYVRANGNWNPNTVAWVAAMAIWLVNIVAGAVYLYRRHEVLGEP